MPNDGDHGVSRSLQRQIITHIGRLIRHRGMERHHQQRRRGCSRHCRSDHRRRDPVVVVLARSGQRWLRLDDDQLLV
jgi:hypothetical protein